jgi:hypothetical protein
MATHAETGGEDATGAALPGRIEAGVRADLAKLGASLRARSDFDDQALEQVIEALRANQPAISDQEIDRIADRLSDRFIEKWENQLAERSARKRVTDRAREIAWGVVSGLITAGALDLIAYLAHSSGLHFESGSEDAPALRQRALETQRRERVQGKLLAGLPDTILRSFADEYQIQEDLREALYRRVTTVVRDTDLMVDFVDLPTWSNGDPFPVADFVETLWNMVAQEVAHSIESGPPAKDRGP